VKWHSKWRIAKLLVEVIDHLRDYYKIGDFMTNKQQTTLVLFAQNYSLVVIAKKQGVSLTTIRQRIKSLSENHSKEFNSALGIREVYKRTRDALRSPKSLDAFLIAKKAKDTAKLLSNGSGGISDIQELF
jgi:predicted DNA-binding protein YlxM (UPF0122 family)